MSTGRILAAVFLLLLIAFAWSAWLFRFDLQITPGKDSSIVAYRLDRWTGNVRLLDDDQWFPVVEGNPDDLSDVQNAPKTSSF